LKGDRMPVEQGNAGRSSKQANIIK